MGAQQESSVPRQSNRPSGLTIARLICQLLSTELGEHISPTVTVDDAGRATLEITFADTLVGAIIYRIYIHSPLLRESIQEQVEACLHQCVAERVATNHTIPKPKSD